MKKLFGAIIVGTMIFGAIFASASLLPVVNGSLQSGTVSVTCQTSPVHVTYNTEFSGAGVNEVNYAKLSPIDAACNGDQALVMLMSNGLGTGATWYSWKTISSADVTAGFIELPFAAGDGFGNTSKPPVETVNYLNVMFSAQ